MAFTTKNIQPFVPLIIFIAWLLYSSLNVASHEVWRDEVHSWAIAKSSATIGDVFDRTEFEGHPSLWYLLLFVLKQFSVDIDAFKWFHFAISAGAIWLLLWRGQFSLIQKTLLVFGYFFVYEYVAIARNYSVALLCLFAFCAFYKKRGTASGIIGCCGSLFLLAFTNLYAYLAAIALGALLNWEIFKHFGIKSLHLPFVFAVWISAAGLGALDIRPSEECIHAKEWKTTFDWSEVFFATSTLWNAYAPVPHQRENFWNSNFFDTKDGQLRIGNKHLPYSWNTANKVKSICGLLVMLFTAFYLRRKPPVLLFFLAITSIYLLLQYTKFQGALRHHGHYWVMLVVSVWLARLGEINVKTIRSLFFPIFYVLLVLHVIGGIIASGYERNYIFSPNQAASQYLSAQHGFSTAPWICDNDFIAEGVAGILGKEILMHSNEYWRWGTYVVWDNKRNFCDQACLVKIAEKLAKEKESDAWLLMYQPIVDTILTNSPGLEKRIHFPPGIENFEQYTIYKMNYLSK